MNIKKSIMSLAILTILLISISAVYAQDNSAYLKTTLLNQDPDPAKPGEYVEVRFKVEKIGLGDLNNIKFELKPSYPFSFDKTDSAIKEIGSWSGYVNEDEQYILKYQLYVDPSAKKNTYDLELVTSYSQNADAGTQTSKYKISVGDKEESSFVIGKLTVSPLELVSDSSDNKLSVSIENIGTGNGEKVVASLELPSGITPSYGYSDRAILGNIASNENKDAEFYIDLDDTIKSGIQNATIVLKYADETDEDNVYKQVRLPLEIPVHGQPKFEITNIVFDPEKVSPGQSVHAHITVKNVGEEDAIGVSLRTFKESSQPFEFTDKTDFIGKLEAGATGEAVISFTVENEAILKEYFLDSEIRGVYNEEVFVSDDLIKINVQESGKEKITMPLALTIVLAILGIIVGFVFGRKRK